MQNRGLFWVFFIILAVSGTYLARLVYQYTFYLIEPSLAIDLIAILLYILIVFPAAAYFAEKLSFFALDRGLENRRNYKIFMTAVIVIPITLFTITKVVNYMEKDLDRVINYNPNKIESIVFDQGFEEREWSTDDSEFAEDFKEFLSQYRVKKINNYEWEEMYSTKGSFMLTIYTKGNIKIASIYEDRLLYANNGSYYKVVDDNIDTQELNRLKQKYN